MLSHKRMEDGAGGSRGRNMPSRIDSSRLFESSVARSCGMSTVLLQNLLFCRKLLNVGPMALPLRLWKDNFFSRIIENSELSTASGFDGMTECTSPRNDQYDIWLPSLSSSQRGTVMRTYSTWTFYSSPLGIASEVNFDIRIVIGRIDFGGVSEFLSKSKIENVHSLLSKSGQC